MPIPIGIDLLLDSRTVESARLECKEGWNPQDVMHTICAFANDLNNWGGGYVLIGVAEQEGRPQLPPIGVSPGAIDRIQKEVLNLAHRIKPNYFPVISPEVVSGKHVVVLWVPGGPNRPYEAPVSMARGEKEYAYYVRVGSSTVKAKGQLEYELLQLAANVPFDDRPNNRARLNDLQLRLIQTHLQDVHSSLFDDSGRMPFVELCERMQIVEGPAEALQPRNVGLLFFNDHPEQWFKTAYIDVVHMPGGPAGGELREKRFLGPLTTQLRGALGYIGDQFIAEHVVKRADRPEADRFWTWPLAAVEEAMANAVYHRSYEENEPIEVRITPDELSITSYPGPDPSVRVDALNKGGVVARRYRNRRIGEFLKDLDLTEGRGTGVPTMFRVMEQNGSPPPRFESDADRTYLTVTLPIHPRVRRDSPSAIAIGSSSATATAKVRTRLPDDERDVTTLPVLLGRPHTRRVLEVGKTPLSRTEIAAAIGLRSLAPLTRDYLKPMLALGLIAYTVPGAPRHPRQQYRTTLRGAEILANAGSAT